jgi:hypothetical protein
LNEEKQEQVKKSGVSSKPDICENPLLCPEEWKEQPGEKILLEFHKGTASGTDDIEVADLKAFDKYWNRESEGNLSSEYHKEGAPYLHEPQTPPAGIAAQWDDIKSDEGLKQEEEQVSTGTIIEEVKGNEIPPDTTDQTRIKRPIDVHMIEVISYALVRVLFSRGINVPIKREGIIDMELKVKDKDIVLDTKELFPLTIPELVIWRFIIAYKGKPVVELGRGVKKGLKIHAFRGLLMLVDSWRANRKQRLMKKRSERAKGSGGIGLE